MRSIVLAAVLSLMGIAAHAQTPTLVDFATISMSAPGVPRTVTDTVCVTDGRDLTCDRGVFITSDSRVGIGTASPQYLLEVSATGVSGSILGIHSKSNVPTGYAIYGNAISSATGAVGGYHNKAGYYGIIGLADYGLFVGGPALLQSNTIVRATLGVNGLFSPTTALQVSGTVRLSSGGEACDISRTGAIRYAGSDFSFCRNGAAWETLSSVASAADRIVSGTSAVVVNSATASISFTTAGVQAMTITSDGRVGIGNAAPSYWLDVSGSGSIAQRLVGAHPDGAVIRYENTGPSGRTYHVGSTQNSGAGTGFSIYDVSASAFRFIVDPFGRVGIGTPSPGHTLTVSGTGWVYGALYVGEPSATSSYFRLNSNASGFNVLAFANDSLERGRIQYQNSNNSLQFAVSGTERMRITSDGSVGIGTGVPQARLSIFGGEIQTSSGGASCSVSLTGAIRFASGDFSFCRNGSAWETLTSLGGGGGASKLASLTDVTTSGAVSGSVLAFNAATSSWTALPIQQVMSTTSMMPGWPDAIRCNVTSPAWGYRVLYLQEAPYLDGTVVYREPSSEPTSESRSVVFNSDGSYNSAGEYTTHTCAKTVSQLYAAGQAFNFIGGSGGSTALGDRITSGTASGVVAMAGGTISFTTGGTSGTAYLDTLGRFVGPGVSATGTVSASKVATNEVLLSKTGGLCSTVADEGRMFRNPTSGKLQVCAVRY